MRSVISFSFFGTGLLLVAEGAFLAPPADPAQMMLGATLVGLPLVLARDGRKCALPEYVAPEEPVDACEHQDAKAAPIDADVDADGVREVIGWLCIECGAKVSEPEAARRNAEPGEVRAWGSAFPTRKALADAVFGLRPKSIGSAREALAGVVGQMDALAAGWKADGGDLILTRADYNEYKRLAGEAEELRKVIEYEAKAIE